MGQCNCTAKTHDSDKLTYSVKAKHVPKSKNETDLTTFTDKTQQSHGDTDEAQSKSVLVASSISTTSTAIAQSSSSTITAVISEAPLASSPLKDTGPWKEKLLRCYKRFVQDAYPDTIIDDCYTEGILTHDEKDKLLTFQTPSDKNRHFLKILLHKSEDTYNRFLECLTENLHIKKLILETDATKPLRHEAEKYAVQLRRKIYCNIQYIVDGPDLKNLLDDFVSERVFEIDDLEKISNAHLTTKEQNTTFLNVLLTKSRLNGYHLLMCELSQTHPDLVEKIKTTAVTEVVDKDIIAHLRIVESQEKGVKLTQEEIERIKMDLHQEEISPGKLEHWIQSENTYYPTKATAKICEKIQTKKKVVASGLAGSGKTAAIHHTALKLKKEGYRLCCVETFNDIKIKMDRFGKKEKQVYVIDDVFGVHGVNESKRKQWGDDNKDEVERCFNNPNISILCSSRIQVLNDTQLNTIKSRFTVVNISEGPCELSKDERAGIFRNHAITKQRNNLLTENKDDLKDDIKERVREVECPVGCFPLVCHLYTGEEEPTQTIEEYFNKPLDVIADHLEKLKVDDPLSHLCLLLCLIYDNKLPVSIITVGDESEETKKQRMELLELCELDKSTSREKIRKKMDTLLQTFVKREGDTYQFVHDIIHDAVIQNVTGLSSSFHQFIIRHCSTKFLLDRVHLSGVVCKDRWGDPGHDTESCNIGSDSFPCWGDRVLDIVRDGVRTSDQLYNDIDEGRCSEDDDRTWWDNPWRDVFWRNPCVRSTEGQDAIARALDRKSSDLQTIMCTKGYSLHCRDPRVTGLHWAMDEGLTHIVTKTVSMLSQTQLQELDSIDGEGLLCWAIRKRCGTDVIKALIHGEVDVNTPDVYGNTPLHKSVGRGDNETTQLLLDKGADVNKCDKYGRSVLFESVSKGGDYKTTQLLLDKGADVNKCDKYGRSVLFESVSKGGDYKTTQLLLDKGADVHKCDKDGKSVLYESQLRGDDTMTEILQSRGAVCMYEGKQYNHVTDIPDLTLLDFVRYNNYQAVKILIERGADVNQCDEDGESALYKSVSSLDPGYTQFSLNKGADGNQCDKDGEPVLYTSVSSMHPVYKISKLLLDNGADVNKCDEEGTSVLYMSQLWEEDTTTELLQSHGAVCMYMGKQYATITDTPLYEMERWTIQLLRKME